MNAIKKLWIPVIGIVVVIGIGSWIAFTNNKHTKEVTHTVRYDEIKQSLTLSGEIEAEKKANLTFQTAGKLAWIGVQLGDTVTKGQVVARLDQQTVKKNLEKYLNLYMTNRWDFEQTKDTYKDTKVITDSIKRTLEKTQFSLNNAVLDVEIQDLALQFSTLTSPIDGIVTRVDSPNAGVNITTTSTIEIIDPTSIYLSVLPDQTEVIKIKEDLVADIVMDSYPQATIVGTIKNIGFEPKDGETSTVYEVKLALTDTNNFSLKYRIGMTGDATFTLVQKPHVLVVPNSFIKQENGNKYVTKKIKNKKEKVPVTLGLESDSTSEIISGVIEGDILYD